jgi:predicted dehydrogenase
VNRKVKIGFVGTGFIGQLAHLMNYVENDNCEIVAIAEYRPELRNKIAKRYNISKTYETHLELLENPEVEAVCVVTPRQHTAPTVLDCLKAGKHVISEKPMACSVEDAKVLVDAANEANVHYVVGYMKRFDEGIQLVKNKLDEFISNDKLGTLIYSRTHCYTGDSYCNPWGHIITEEKVSYPDTGWKIAPEWLPNEWESKYHTYLNTYSHNTNLLRYLLGIEPLVKNSHVARNNGQLAVLDFSGTLGLIETGMSSNRGWDEVTEFFFTDGRITIESPPALLRNVPSKVLIYHAGDSQETIIPQSNWSWSFRRQADAFINCILTDEKSISSGTEALKDLELIEEIWRKDPIIADQIQI